MGAVGLRGLIIVCRLFAPASCASSGSPLKAVVIDGSGVLRREGSLRLAMPGDLRPAPRGEDTTLAQFLTQVTILAAPHVPTSTDQRTGAVPQMPAQFIEHLPRDIKALGLNSFGTVSALSRFLGNLNVPQIYEDDGVNLTLVSSRFDDSIPRMAQQDWNFGRGDPYGIRNVTETRGTIVDVGANLGDMTILAAKLHPQLQVLAFEPVPSTFFLARLNLRLNNIRELREEELGMPHRSGVLLLNRAVTQDGRSVNIGYTNSSVEALIVPGPSAKHTYETAMVKSVKMPDYLVSHNAVPVLLMKMDCEGCEFEIIPAMQGFVDNRSKVLRFSGEIHFDTLNNQIHHSLHPYLAARGHAPVNNATVVLTESILAKRGCKLWSFVSSC